MLSNTELYHHGILGQKWGVRNGPPYPLGASDHSASEKKAGWRKSLDKQAPEKHTESSKNAKKSEDTEKHGLTDRQKRALRIGAAAAVTALAAYGTYRLAKSGKLDPLIGKGKEALGDLFEKNKAGSADNISRWKADDLRKEQDNLSDIFNYWNIDSLSRSRGTANSTNGLKKLARPETVAERIKNTNPILLKDGADKGKYNCVCCGIASYLRGQGYDVTAKGSVKGYDTISIAEKCFRNPKILEGSAVKFGRSRQDAAEMLVERFGQNAEGLCAIQWHNSETNSPGGGHCFNWIIKNGVVEFFDAQSNRDDSVVSKHYWKKDFIDPDGHLRLIRLDGCEVNEDAILEFVDNNRR